ncbi:hypothetical protein H5T52_10390, partial [Candidatus Bipolaricaulota bacterium]|nr:hypothetical protein [Candidatus Bipolaricaulota bacterium]
VRPGGEIRFENDLWPAAVRLRPELETLRRALEGIGGLGVGMTGSGSALFSAFSRPQEAEEVMRALKGKVKGKAFVARPVRRGYKFIP